MIMKEIKINYVVGVNNVIKNGEREIKNTLKIIIKSIEMKIKKSLKNIKKYGMIKIKSIEKNKCG